MDGTSGQVTADPLDVDPFDVGTSFRLTEFTQSESVFQRPIRRLLSDSGLYQSHLHVRGRGPCPLYKLSISSEAGSSPSQHLV